MNMAAHGNHNGHEMNQTTRPPYGCHKAIAEQPPQEQLLKQYIF